MWETRHGEVMIEESIWERRDRRVLRAISMGGDPSELLPADLKADLGASLQLLAEDGLIRGPMATSVMVRGAVPTGPLRVTAKGLRLLGEWPIDTSVNHLLAALNRTIAGEGDEPRKRALVGFQQALVDVATTLGAKTLAEVVARTTGA